MFPRNILFLISACLVWFVLRRSQVKIQIFIFSAELCNETFYVVVKIVVLVDCWFFSLYLWGTGGEGRGSEACFVFFPNPAKSRSEDSFIRVHAS